MTETERDLRARLWLNHGCEGGGNLYGDDGEMQCHACGSDFLRQSLSCIAENISSPAPGNFWKEKTASPQKKYTDGIPCGHKGCLFHVSHPCEGCGRIAGRTV